MAKIDEVKSHIDWLKDLFKVLVAILVADIAGISKLYLDLQINILYYAGIILARNMGVRPRYCNNINLNLIQ